MTRRKTWDESLAGLSAWVDTHGRLPASGGASDEEKDLAQWTSIQRTRARKGNLPGSQAVSLSAVIGDPTRRGGEVRRNELPEWVAANGRLPGITRDPARAGENLLAHKLYRLRKAYRSGAAKLHQLELLLSIPEALEGRERAGAEARAAELRAVDEARLAAIRARQDQVPFDAARWEASFIELQGWVSDTGALPRRRTDDPGEYKVANWLNIQRTHARNNTLDAAREAKLRTVQGALEPQHGRASGDRLADLAAFQATHGRLPSFSAADPEESSLWLFLNRAVAGRVGGPQAASIRAAALEIRSAYPVRGTVGDIVSRFEHYVTAHGHLPPDSKKLHPPLRKISLRRALAAVSTPAPVKEKIRGILASPVYRDRAAVCPLGDACHPKRGEQQPALRTHGAHEAPPCP